MIDSIKAFFPEGAVDPEILAEVRPNGKEGFHGRLGNLYVIQMPDGVLISGSLQKYFRGENVSIMTREQYQEAIRRIETATGLDADGSIVRTVEIGATIPVDHPPRDYMAGWGTISRFPKSTYGDGTTVLYSVRRRSFQGYDKAKEMKQKEHKALPPGFPGPHAIRLEFKIKRGIKAELGRTLSLREVTEKDTFTLLRNRWVGWYRRIPKAKVFAFVSHPTTGREFTRFLAVAGTLLIGQEELDRMIKGIRADGGCSSSNASNMSKIVRELHATPGICRTDSLARELDAKVEELASREW